MEKTITTTIEKTKIIEIKVSWHASEANALLKTEEWILLQGAIAHKGDDGFQAKPCFIMGKIVK